MLGSGVGDVSQDLRLAVDPCCLACASELIIARWLASTLEGPSTSIAVDGGMGGFAFASETKLAATSK